MRSTRHRIFSTGTDSITLSVRLVPEALNNRGETYRLIFPSSYKGKMMNYYVIGADGTKYGPADISTLNLWIADSRLVPTMELEEEGTGRRLQAKDVIGLQFPAFTAPPQQFPGNPGPTPSYYYRPTSPDGTDGRTEVAIAWVLGVIGLFFCPIVISTIGIILSIQANKKGNPGAQAALIFCIISLVVGMILGAIIGLNNARQILGR